MGRGAAREAANQLAARGATWLISAGVSGGLRPGLSLTSIIEIGRIVEPDGRQWPAAPLPGLSPSIRDALQFCSPRILSTPAEKLAVHQTWLADTVDMESGGVAEVAQMAGLRFSSVRALSDGPADALPLDFTPFLDARGQLRSGALLAGLLFRPWVLPGLVRLGCRTHQASHRLARSLAAAIQPGRVGDETGEVPGAGARPEPEVLVASPVGRE
jgi:adenosylhomocysteine nucleosidase